MKYLNQFSVASLPRTIQIAALLFVDTFFEPRVQLTKESNNILLKIMNFYLSQIISDPIFNQTNDRIGTLEDLIISDMSKTHPTVTGILVKRPGFKKQTVFIPYHDIVEINLKTIKLKTDLLDLSPFKRRGEEVLLCDEVYDKQIVDVDDRRLTRVNDLLLEKKATSLSLKGVDVSFGGILRRLQLPEMMFRFIKPNIVDWEDVQFLGGNEPVKFNIKYNNLERLQPLDIARVIFEGPGYKAGSRVLEQLQDPIAADIIEELSPKLQKNLIESMQLTDVADLFKQMSPHKAADVLLSVGNEYVEKILPLLDKNEAEQIRTLLKYPSQSTGAYMVVEYVIVYAAETIEQVLSRVRNMEELPDFLQYFYVLENEYTNKLIGILSPHEIFKSQLRSRVDSVMNKKFVVAHPTDHIKESLRKMFRYNIGAIPVVTKPDNKILGVVVFRDAVSIYLPHRWKMRFGLFFES